MEEININLVQLLKLNLNVNEYLTLIKLKLLSDDIKLQFSTTEAYLTSLIEKGYLEVVGENIQFSDKGMKVFKQAGVTISEQDFMKFFTLYPMRTPGGRKLRASSNGVGGRMSRDYEVCYRKYCNQVKSLEQHDDVMKATQLMIYDYKRRGSSEFMQNLETYINQRSWEKYLESDIVEIYGENIERL